MAEVTPTSKRKADHIRVNLDEDVRSALTTGLERYRFEHQALPEIDLREVDARLTFLGVPLAAPLLISSMTGGTEQAARINFALAEAAQERGIAMGLGSLRAAIENPDLAHTYQVRGRAPDILLLANLGAVQLNYGYGPEHCQKAIDLVEADALILHFNSLQEALQPEGDTNFSALLSQIERVCRRLEKPVVAKEVGWGISVAAAKALLDAGVRAIDVAGAGGTSWSQVEMHRAQSAFQARLAAAFIDWGIPTAEAVMQLRRVAPDAPIIASGGLRNGLDIAKCIALGADMGGMAGPFLKAAARSAEDVVELIDQTVSELRICMFGTGSRDLGALRKTELVPIP
jgi:isopentenyl-diphosphate delta-isomerase